MNACLAMFWAAVNYLFVLAPKIPNFILNFALVFLPTIGYLDQLKNMIKTKSSDCFKPGSSIVLLISNFLRIIYWMFDHFELYLLNQSLAMVVIQLTLVGLSYKYKEYKPGEEIYKPKRCIRKMLSVIQLYDASSFIEFLFGLTVIYSFIIGCALLGSMFVDKAYIGSAVGLAANGIDSFTTFPQFLIIVFRRDTRYVTPLLLLQWISACALKVGLFIWKPVPWPFIVGTGIQGFFTTSIALTYVDVSYIRNKKYEIPEEDDTNTPQDLDVSVDVEMGLEENVYPKFDEVSSE